MTKNVDDWRLLNLPDSSAGIRKPFAWFLNLFRARRRLRDLDAVAAAVSRCEAILKEHVPPAREGDARASAAGFAYRIEGRHKRLGVRGRDYPAFSGRFDFTSKDARTEPDRTPLDPSPETKRPGPPRDLLLGLVRGEGALQRYLRAADEDPALALANAKGDVAYLNSLRSSDLLKFKPRAAFGKALLPILIVGITAFSANVVGVRLQNSSMENTRKFEASLERLRESQRLAGSLYASAVDFHLRTPSQEVRGAVGQAAIDNLEDFRRQLTQVSNMIYGRANEDINKAWADAEEQINEGEKCFREEVKNSNPPKPLCSERFKHEPFLRLKDSISDALVKYLD